MTSKKKQPKTIEEQVEELLGKLTAAQREALLHRQLGLFDAGNANAAGVTATSLRRRGLIGAQKAITDLGARVVQRLEAAPSA